MVARVSMPFLCAGDGRTRARLRLGRDQCGVVELIGTLLAAARHGSQREAWLADVLAASKRVAYCITEAEAGTDVSGVKTTAVRDGDGWSLSGSKIWIHNAPVADVGFVLARTDPAAGNRGMSIFIVDLHAKGVSRGKKEQKMGQRACRWARSISTMWRSGPMRCSAR